jgi:sugar O-acyltransferase (sialic acid O-acetyltransferase NeuD family)
MDDIILIGGGGHCKSVIDVIELENKYKIVGIVDKKALLGEEILGYKVIGCDDDLPILFTKYKNAVITVGQIKSNTSRVKLLNILKNIGYKLPIIKSPLAYISKHAHIKEGTIIMHQALVNAYAKIGKNCIINTKALVEHDVIIEDNCHISTAAIINGGVIVKENSFIGSNAVTKEYIEINNNFIKAGSIVK